MNNGIYFAEPVELTDGEQHQALLDSAGHLKVAASNTSILPDGNSVAQISTTMGKFGDGFNGSSLDLEKWNVARQVGNATFAVSGGNLTITPGAVIDDELLLIGKADMTVPVNLMAVLSISVRHASRELRLGIVEVDDNGDPIPHTTPVARGIQFNNMAAVDFNSATVTAVNMETINESSALKTQALASQATTAAAAEYFMCVRPDAIKFESGVADTVATKTAVSGRISSQVPNHRRRYRPFIWVRNVAAATATVITINRFLTLDVQELYAEIVGTGSISLQDAIAVNVVNPAALAVTSTSTALAAGTATIGATFGAASVTANGATAVKLIAAATTNATVLKASAGKLLGGYVFNTSAAPKFLKFYNKATAPTVGTDIPVWTIPVEAGGHLSLAQIFDQLGLSFASGIGYAITGAVADADTTAVAAGDVILNLLYV